MWGMLSMGSYIAPWHIDAKWAKPGVGCIAPGRSKLHLCVRAWVCIYSWSPASSSLRVWHRLGTLVDTHSGVDTCPSLWVHPRYTERADEVAVSQSNYAYWLFRFSWHISQTQSFQENRYCNILGLRSLEAVGITHWPPHSLKCQNSCRQIDRQTDTQTKCCKPSLQAHARWYCLLSFE